MSRYNLGQIHEWQNVDYVKTEDDLALCMLCGTGWMTTRSRRRHFNGSKHRRIYNRVKREQEEEQEEKHQEQIMKHKFLFAKSLHFRIDRIEHLGWRRHIKSCLYNYMTGYSITTITQTKVTDLLSKYELMEMASLLELAIIKQNVCGGVTFSSMQEVEDYEALEDGFNPKAFFNEVKVTCGSDVIIPLVLKFL